MAEENRVQERMHQLELDLRAARRWAAEGKLEAWVHHYLLSGEGGVTNPEFSAGLKLAARWWRGPVEVDIADLSAVVGIEPGMEYVVEESQWRMRVRALADTLTDPGALPPLIIEYRAGALSVRDGNTRLAAMKEQGWSRCWVVVWYNSEADYAAHGRAMERPPRGGGLGVQSG